MFNHTQRSISFILRLTTRQDLSASDEPFGMQMSVNGFITLSADKQTFTSWHGCTEHSPTDENYYSISCFYISSDTGKEESRLAIVHVSLILLYMIFLLERMRYFSISPPRFIAATETGFI